MNKKSEYAEINAFGITQPSINVPCSECMHKNVCKYRDMMKTVRDGIKRLLSEETDDDLRSLIYQVGSTCHQCTPTGYTGKG